jgi:hypothetical protein
MARECSNAVDLGSELKLLSCAIVDVPPFPGNASLRQSAFLRPSCPPARSPQYVGRRRAEERQPAEAAAGEEGGWSPASLRSAAPTHVHAQARHEILLQFPRAVPVETQQGHGVAWDIISPAVRRELVEHGACARASRKQTRARAQPQVGLAPAQRRSCRPLNRCSRSSTTTHSIGTSSSRCAPGRRAPSGALTHSRGCDRLCARWWMRAWRTASSSPAASRCRTSSSHTCGQQ